MLMSRGVARFASNPLPLIFSIIYSWILSFRRRRNAIVVYVGSCVRVCVTLSVRGAVANTLIAHFSFLACLKGQFV